MKWADHSLVIIAPLPVILIINIYANTKLLFT
jgi:hypothetical protein